MTPHKEKKLSQIASTAIKESLRATLAEKDKRIKVGIARPTIGGGSVAVEVEGTSDRLPEAFEALKSKLENIPED